MAGFIAGRYVLDGEHSDDLLGPREQNLFEARSGSISEAYDIPIVASAQELGRHLYIGDSGILTETVLTSTDVAEVASGTEVFRVNNFPTIAVQGEIAAYREISEGSSGPDVAAIADLLRESGYLDASMDVDVFNSEVAAAVQDWWLDRGVDGLSSFPLGSVVFIEGLPRALSLTTELAAGVAVSTNTAVIRSFSPDPQLVANLTEVQSLRYLNAGGTFLLESGEVLDVAKVSSESGVTIVQLEAASTHVVVTGVGVDRRLAGVLVVSAPVEGTIVPFAAVDLDANDESRGVVLLEDGTSVDVRVVGVVGGEAVVEPLEEGTMVVVS